MSARPGWEFVDTNVLVYAYDRSGQLKHDQAGALLRRLWQDRTGCLSLQVLQEFYVTLTRNVPHRLPEADATQIVRDLSVWRVHAPIVSDLLDALAVAQRYQLSLWDALVIQSASRLGCSVLWSEDLNAGQLYGTVRVQDPFS